MIGYRLDGQKGGVVCLYDKEKVGAQLGLALCYLYFDFFYICVLGHHGT